MTFDEAIKSQETTFGKYRAHIFNEECLQYDGFYICGGGCPAQGEALLGSRNEIDKPFCIHTKKSLVWLLKITLRKFVTFYKYLQEIRKSL